jgi:hypothetical protein
MFSWKGANGPDFSKAPVDRFSQRPDQTPHRALPPQGVTDHDLILQPIDAESIRGDLRNTSEWQSFPKH